MSDAQKICVLTIHGIGFQQPPTDTLAGYADVLHENLGYGLAELGVVLGNDPQRTPHPFGPVYVKSARPGSHNHEWGLRRLGSWRGDAIDITGMPLTEGDEPVAHVALVYSSLEGIGPGAVTGAGTLAEASLTLGHYASVAGAFRLVVGDTWAALHHNTRQSGKISSPSLKPRADLVTADRHHLAAITHRKPAGDGALGVLRTLEDDVVAYVCRNNLRESIRQFIAEALRRLLGRPDVSGVVINAHSQGTVGSYDVLRLYPPQDLTGVRALVTAGSPLRKYSDLFSWGENAGRLQSVPWLNFWDRTDPVADPLNQPKTWRYGDPVESRPGAGLFWAMDTDDANTTPVPITDIRVDNLKNSSGGGLQAHNYWDNTAEFIPELARVVTTAPA